MLPTQELFRSIPCPYYVVGLCEKPHCFFRHTRSDVLEARRILLSSVVNDDESKAQVSTSSSSPIQPNRLADKSNEKHNKEEKNRRSSKDSKRSNSSDSKAEINKSSSRSSRSSSSSSRHSKKETPKSSRKESSHSHSSKKDSKDKDTSKSTSRSSSSRSRSESSKKEKSKDGEKDKDKKLSKDRSSSHNHKSSSHSRKDSKDSSGSSSKHSSHDKERKRSKDSTNDVNKDNECASNTNPSASVKIIDSPPNTSISISVSDKCEIADQEQLSKNIESNANGMDEDSSILYDFHAPEVFDEDFEDDPDDIEMECLKMFEEYQPEEKPKEEDKMASFVDKFTDPAVEKSSSSLLGKRRTAHAGADARPSACSAPKIPKTSQNLQNQLARRLESQKSALSDTLRSSSPPPADGSEDSDADTDEFQRRSPTCRTSKAARKRISHVANVKKLIRNNVALTTTALTSTNASTTQDPGEPKGGPTNQSNQNQPKNNQNQGKKKKKSPTPPPTSGGKRGRKNRNKGNSSPQQKPKTARKNGNGKQEDSCSSSSSAPSSPSASTTSTSSGVSSWNSVSQSASSTPMKTFNGLTSAGPVSTVSVAVRPNNLNRQQPTAKLPAAVPLPLIKKTASSAEISSSKIKTPSNPVNKETNKNGKVGSTSAGTIAQTHAKGTTRKAHIPSARPVKEKATPKILSDSPVKTSKISYTVRQYCLDEIFKLCKQLCDHFKSAFERAIREEAEIAVRASSTVLYKSKIGAKISSLRREVQVPPSTENNRVKNNELGIKPTPTTLSPARSLLPLTDTSYTPLPPFSSSSSSTSILSNASSLSSSNLGHVSNRPKGSLLALHPELPRGNALYKKLFNYVLTEAQLEENGFPRPSKDNVPGRVIARPRHDSRPVVYEEGRKTCDRCNKVFHHEPDGSQPNESGCEYHPGRFQRKQTNKREWSKFYSCCGSESIEASPCAFHPVHVPRNLPVSEQQGFVSAIKDAANEDEIGNEPWDLIALDCEMVHTTGGNELARATFVGQDGTVLYDSVVKPSRKVLDYNTKWSGLTEEDVNSTNTTLQDVQAIMLMHVRPNTIMIGHSLESDLVALKFLHDCAIDTSVMFPHRLGPPLKRGLKTLASEFLSRIVQESENGHDSSEDALTALDLVLYKLREDSKISN